MADDPDRDLIPTKDVKSSYVSHNAISTESSEILGPERSAVLERKIAEHLSRNNLEDQLYRLRDENLELKKASRKQEDQLKKLTTKLSRLLAEKKKLDLNSSPGRKRDIEMEEAIEDLHDKVRNLEKSNIQLREKLLVAKQQVITQARRPNAYPHIQAKVNTQSRPRSGISTYGGGSSHIRNAIGQSSQRKNAPGSTPSYVLQLLDEARIELFNLKELASNQKNEIDIYEQEVEILKERLRMKDSEFEEELNALKAQITEGQRQHVQENLDLIRLHRELNQKNSKIVALQAQIAESEEKLKASRASYDRVAKELDDKTLLLQEEQKKSLDLFTELQKNKAALLNLADLQENLKSLKKENEVLKETNEKLINSVLSQEKPRESNNYAAEQSLKEQIAHIESALKSEVKEKETLEGEIRAEKEKYRQLNEEYKKLQDSFSDVRNQMAEMESKLNILKSEEVDFEELGEALALVKLKKQHSINMNFLGGLQDDSTEEELKSKLEKAERDHAETIKELHGVREMLMTQYKINKDSQEEVRVLTEKLAQQESEYQTKLEEYANLLDLRAARIQKLEKQLNDIAYGTKKFKIKDYKEETDSIETLDLGRGENIFEVHIKKFVYTNDGLSFLKNNNPSSFFTWNFYEFQLQSTSVVKGSKPNFDCTSQYKIKMDDFFLLYMQKNSTVFELHESLGTDYRTLAACQINFCEALEQPQGRLHGMQELISVCESAKGVIFGTLHYWVRFKVPAIETFQLYKERLKALKYMQGNERTTTSAVEMLNRSPKTNPSMNELHIKIIRCNELKGKNKDVQPSPFCVYKFYDLQDQDTIIIPASNNPEFGDHRTFPLCVDADLEKYLKTQNLLIYVFDDDDTDMSSYIGRASVPLLPLSQGKHIKGLYQLQKENKADCGSLELSMYWRHPYIPAGAASLPEHLEKPIEYPVHMGPVTAVDSELEETSSAVESEDKYDYSMKVVPVPKPRKRMNKPIMTSTPVKNQIDNGGQNLSVMQNASFIKSDTNGSRQSSGKSSSSSSHSSTRRPKSSKEDEGEESRTNELNHKSTEKAPENMSSPICSPKRKGSNELGVAERFDTTCDELDSDDTVAGKQQEMSFEVSEMSDDDRQALSESLSSSSSETEVKTTISVETHNAQSPVIPSITIGIWHLALKPGSSVLDDPNIQMLYVEYRFLDYNLEEMETPYSLPKPMPPDTITYGYKKVFPFDPRENKDKYMLLSEMFKPDMPEASWIKFTVVSEPPSDEEDLECEDVGYAYVNLREILQKGKDIIEENITIYDVKDNETEIGKLNVTVEALGVLKILQGLK